jgi:hypothetical protein
MRLFDVRWIKGEADHPFEHTRFMIQAERLPDVLAEFPGYDTPDGIEGGWLVVPIKTISLEEAKAAIKRKLKDPKGGSHAEE